MDLIRIGSKVVSRQRLIRSVETILSRRERGASQQEAATLAGVDRSFVSWLEKLGEIRRGRRVAVVGFPVANKQELLETAREEGVDFTLLLSDRERWVYAEQMTGAELINDVMMTLTTIKEHDVVILMGSDWRIRVMRELMDVETIDIELGTSPLNRDVYVDPEMLRRQIRAVRK